MNEIENADSKNTDGRNMDDTHTDGKGADSRNIIWGALFLIGAVALLMNKLGFLNLLLGGMSFFQIVATVFLVGALVKGMAKHSFGQILFSVAFIIIVNDKVLHMEALTPWPVLGAALLGTIGLHFMFPKVRSGYGRLLKINGREIRGPLCEERRKGDRLWYENCFGESVRYVSGEVRRMDLENSFGSLQVYFTDAQLMEGTAEVFLENSFGSTVLYVPSNWKVVLNMEHAFGGTDERGQCVPDGRNVLYVKGEVAFGKVQIRYI